jgi:tetratricopeptide (TPR) repeat protein
VLLVQKKYAAAEPLLQSIAKAHPDDFAAHATLGMALAGEQEYAAAQSEFQAAQRLNPNDPAIGQLIAANASKAGAEQTLVALAGQLEQNPPPAARAQAAMAESILGRYAEAARQYKLALAQKTDAAEWLNNLAWLLATCPDATVRNGPEAVQLAGRACALTQYKKTVYLGTLAAACAEAGRFDDAILNAQKACDNASAQGETELLAANQKLLALYQNQQAYHEPAAPAAP